LATGAAGTVEEEDLQHEPFPDEHAQAIVGVFEVIDNGSVSSCI
jgi:hypothetical protein